MSIEEPSMERLRAAVEQARDHVQILEYAVGNIAAVCVGSETETLAFYSTYEHVVAVWMDGDHLIMRWVKGGSANGVVTPINAIPVENESEARRWAVLLNSGDASIPAERSLKLAAVNGRSLLSETK